ncbi:MAG: hypothetical protein AAFS10_18065 [Myxococcota bacterium]
MMPIPNFEETVLNEFRKLSRRFDGVEAQLTNFNTRMETVETKLDVLTERVDGLEEGQRDILERLERVERLEGQFRRLDGRVEHAQDMNDVFTKAFKRHDARMDRLESEIEKLRDEVSASLR